jgi:AmmeMemoRadiSam system protein B
MGDVHMEDRLRPPAVAGTFYPADPARLREVVDGMLAEVASPNAETAAPRAVIAPHAGYVYSGPVAAHAYARLAKRRDRLRRVLLIGPAHRKAIAGMALPAVTGLATPLGTVPIDRDAATRLADELDVTFDDGAHALEHSLEVQLPFLQRTLASFAVVPLVVGRCASAAIARVMAPFLEAEDAAVVVSSDLSHYLPYDRARAVDRATIARIVDLGAEPLHHDEACGATPVNGLRVAVRAAGLTAELLDLRSSGDTAGPRDEVVGYAALAFTRKEPS